MPPKHVAPAISLTGFSCPACGALADQAWYDVMAQRTDGNQPPSLINAEDLKRFKDELGHKDEYKHLIPELEKRSIGVPWELYT